jgi:hypothetical protein
MYVVYTMTIDSLAIFHRVRKNPSTEMEKEGRQLLTIVEIWLTIIKIYIIKN